ncbi:hypothetical protein BaRGS_00034577, partial [Batillaria attramentaria]
RLQAGAASPHENVPVAIDPSPVDSTPAPRVSFPVTPPRTGHGVLLAVSPSCDRDTPTYPSTGLGQDKPGSPLLFPPIADQSDPLELTSGGLTAPRSPVMSRSDCDDATPASTEPGPAEHPPALLPAPRNSYVICSHS